MYTQKKVQERLGHSSIAITMDTYSHVLPSMHQDVAHKLDDLFEKEWFLLFLMLKLTCFFKGLFCFFVTLEVVEGMAFVVVDKGKVGVKADGLLVGSQSFLVSLEVSEG